MDEGSSPGWQCPDSNNGPCTADPKEGNNILDGVETPIVSNKPLSEIISEGGVKLPVELEASTTYYLGVKWTVLPTVETLFKQIL
jgi:hypothetical protein